MKKLFTPPRQGLLKWIALGLIGMVSCNEPLPIDTSDSGQVNSKEIQLAQDKLKIYGQAVLSLGNNPDFRAELYSEIDKSFDGDRNVLFKTLIEEGRTNSRFARSLKDNLLALNPSALHAFNNIEGNNYFPQVFIPFYDELKASAKLGVSNPNIIIYTHPSPNSVYQSYKLNSEGTLLPDKLISENFAKENEVWVISINERVDNDGLAITKANTNSKTSGASYPNAKFVTIKIDTHKEEWVSGGSEVHIKRYLSFYRYDQYSSSQAVLQVTSEDALNDGDGWRIKEVNRKDVGKTLTVNWNYVGDWPNKYYNFSDGSSYHTDYFYYVVFEYDPWPTGMRTASIPDLGLSGLTIPTNYRSADTYYKQSYIPESGTNTWTSSTGFHFTSEY